MNNPKTAIIAEAGVNHNGSIDTAKIMIAVAAKAGADFVKFQTFRTEALVTLAGDTPEYQKELTGTEESQFTMLKKLELDRAAHEELIQYCELKGIRFLSTAFDHDSIDLLAELNIPFYKIPSGEITNLPYLRHIGCMGKSLIMSTGMATLEEVLDALDILLEAGTKKDKITCIWVASGTFSQIIFDLGVRLISATDGSKQQLMKKPSIVLSPQFYVEVVYLLQIRVHI